MRKSKFTEEQIASIVTQAQAGVPVEELCRKYGISVQTFYRWRSKFAGLTPSELRRMKELEEENRRLKRVVADLTLDKQILQDVLRKKD
jgi:putative transposase